MQKSIVPFGKKIAFGLGMLANQMFPAALGIFMVVLVHGLGVSIMAGCWVFVFYLEFLTRSQTRSWDLYLTILDLDGVGEGTM